MDEMDSSSDQWFDSVMYMFLVRNILKFVIYNGIKTRGEVVV